MPMILALRFLPATAGYDLNIAAGVFFFAWFITAWIALRRMFRWQCASCRKPFFGETRVRLLPRYWRVAPDEVYRCMHCATLLSS